MRSSATSKDYTPPTDPVELLHDLKSFKAAKSNLDHNIKLVKAGIRNLTFTPASLGVDSEGEEIFKGDWVEILSPNPAQLKYGVIVGTCKDSLLKIRPRTQLHIKHPIKRSEAKLVLHKYSDPVEKIGYFYV
mmetsp:Transcript_13380/g.19137  ORF Transcript_13380/g.19137 Transcript_13380/m.19137 type:complete len:132 (-) Transcript_13380:5168-5563(-)